MSVNGFSSLTKNIFSLAYKARPIYILYERAHLKESGSTKTKDKGRPRYSRKMEKL